MFHTLQRIHYFGHLFPPEIEFHAMSVRRVMNHYTGILQMKEKEEIENDHTHRNNKTTATTTKLLSGNTLKIKA